MNNQQSAAPSPEAQKMALYSKVWSDDDFRAALEQDPKAALAQIGYQVPDNLEVRVVVDTENTKYFHIPEAPAEGEISDGELMHANGGTTPVCAVISAGVVTAVGSGVGSYYLSDALK